MKIAVLIPAYNHCEALKKLLSEALSMPLDFLVINDGSSDKTQEMLEQLVITYKNLQIFSHETNQGKGQAIVTGMLKLIEDQYTHAITIDADGQHDLADLEKFKNLIQANPEKLILGKPTFSNDAPLERRLGREISNFLVRLETLNFKIEDVLCGYRAYPLKHCRLFIESTKRLRMDFDLDILVWLFRNKVQAVYLPTKVRYPINGISHFNYLKDNWSLFKLHSFHLLSVFPYLIKRLING